mgnify:CR=1 FL=1
MNTYPVQLNLNGSLCVVVGGGRVGERKVRSLLDSGAQVRLVEPRDSAPACRLAGIERIARCFEPQDLAGARLVFAASDDSEVNSTVAELCRKQGLLCNRADDPTGGDFSLPAQLRRGDLLMTVSSNGAHPGFSAALRDRLSADYDESWTAIAALARVLRRRRLTPVEAETYNRKVLQVLQDRRLPGLFASRNIAGIESVLREFLGHDFPTEEIESLLPTESS